MYKLLSRSFWTEQGPCHFEFRNPQPPFPMHSHEFHELAIVYSGEGLHITPQETIRLKAGDVVSVKPGQIHGYEKIDNLVLMNILVHSSFFADENNGLTSVPGYSDLFQPFPPAKNTNQPVSHFRLNKLQGFEVRAIIETMQGEIANQNLSWVPVTTAYLIQLTALLLRIYNDPNYPASAEKNNAAALVKYMEKNYKQTLSMQDLMDFSSMSESSVLRTFKRITGYPPFEYQMRQRMFSAINELISTDNDITQIAYDTGFNDSNYFSRCFKKFISMTPSEYRKQFGQPAIDDSLSDSVRQDDP